MKLGTADPKPCISDEHDPRHRVTLGQLDVGGDLGLRPCAQVESVNNASHPHTQSLH